MDRLRKSRAVRTVIATLCVVLVMVATTAEAGHSCESPLAQPHGKTDVRTIAGGAVPCLLCLGVHSPSLAAPISAVAPDLLTYEVATSILPDAHPSVAEFALYTRPPPAL